MNSWRGRVRGARPLALLATLLIVVSGSGAFAQSQLTLKLREAGSGLPADARLRIGGPAGWLFADPDPALLTHFTPEIGHWIHASDSLVIDVAPGQYQVWVTRGITTVPERWSVDVSGSVTAVLPIQDWIDPTGDGWYGADPHVHLSHESGSVYPALSLDQAAIAARAEGLDLMFILENDPVHAGGPVTPPHSGTTLVWGEEYRNAMWGHTVMLGLDALITTPVGTGCCGTFFPAWPTLTWTFENEAAALRILAHPRSTNTPLVPFDGFPGSGYARELGALALSDGLDGFAVAGATNEGHPWAFEDYLDATRLGARWAAVGEGDCPLDRFEVAPPGQVRTYAWIGSGWSDGDPGLSDAWEAAVRDRRCYATTGPIVRDFGIGASTMGEEFDLGAPGLVDVDLSIASLSPLSRITLHGATGTHWDFMPDEGVTALDTTVTLAIAQDDFVMLEVQATEEGRRDFAFASRAVTSPIWVEAGSPWPLDPALVRGQIDELNAFFQFAAEERGFGTEADSIEAWNDIVGAAGQYEAMVDDLPAAFDLVSPDDSAALVGVTVDLDWTESVSFDSEPVTYRVRVALDPGFVSPAVDVITSETSYLAEGLPAPNGYHWMVEAIEPGEPPTPASGAPRSFYLSGGVTNAPAELFGPPLELQGLRADGAGFLVSLRLLEPMQVTLRWVDVRGRVVGGERLGHLAGGIRELRIPARDHHGNVLARGVYWVIAESGEHRDVARVVWTR